MVIESACRYFGIDEKDLMSSTKGRSIAYARALIGYIATRELSITGSEVARRLNLDRSAISRAVQKVSTDMEAISTAGVILKTNNAQVSQQWNNVPVSTLSFPYSWVRTHIVLPLLSEFFLLRPTMTIFIYKKIAISSVGS